MLLENVLPSVECVTAVEPDGRFNEKIHQAFTSLKDRKIQVWY